MDFDAAPQIGNNNRDNNRNRRNNANRQQRNHQPVANGVTNTNTSGINLTVTMKDVLELIPSYSGDDLCEFVCFKHGCKEALKLIGSENEMKLLVFLKLKLKGLMYAKYSLHMSKYESIQMFIDHLEKDFYPFIEFGSAWKGQFNHIHQKEYETIDMYYTRFQHVLQCTRIYHENHPFINELFTINTGNGTLTSKINYWERKAKYYFIQNLMSVRLQKYLAERYDLNESLESLMQNTYDKHQALKEDSTCKLCLEKSHVDLNCEAMKRNYYSVFKKLMSREKYEIINDEDDPFPRQDFSEDDYGPE